MTARRKWTEARLQWVHEQWKTRNMADIAAELGMSRSGLRSAVNRAGITCPVPREVTLGRRRAFGSVDRAERDRRRRWYRMWRGLTVQGVPFDERVERMRAAGCTLTPRQLRVGWSCYQRTHLSDGRD